MKTIDPGHVSEQVSIIRHQANHDPGEEATHGLEVKDFQVRVTNDRHGGDLFRAGIDHYRKD